MTVYTQGVVSLNRIIDDVEGSGGAGATHRRSIDAYNAIAILLGGDGGHRRNIDALNEISGRLGGATAFTQNIGALNAISGAIGGATNFTQNIKALNVIAEIGLGGAEDSTAPTLSSPTDVETGQTTADLGVTTNEGNGTLYCVVTQSATTPSKAQIKAGQTHTGAAADFADDQAVASVGVKAFSATALDIATDYFAHFMHEDASGNQSTALSADGFTTNAEPPVNLTPPSFTGTMTAGQTLTRVAGTWTGNPTPTIAGQWFSDGVAIPGETATTLVSTGLGGTEISYGESAENDGGTETAASAEEYLFTNEAARALVARITSEPVTFWKAAYDQVYSVSGFTTALAKIEQFAMLSGPDAQASCLDWGAVRSLSNNGTMTFLPGEGAKTNGTTGYLGSGVLANAAGKMTQNSGSLITYVKTCAAGIDVNQVIGWASSTDRFRLGTGSSTNTAGGRINDAATFGPSNGSAPTGLFSFVRTGASARILRRNGVSLGNDTQASAAPLGSEITYFRRSSGTYLNNSVVVSMVAFGDGTVDATDEAALKNGVETFNTYAAPYELLIVGGGQSNIQNMGDNSSTAGGGSGTGAGGSNAVERIMVPELQVMLDAYQTTVPNYITQRVYWTAFSASGISEANTPGVGWWDRTLNAGAGGPGPSLVDWEAEVRASPVFGTTHAVILWAQGGSDMGSNYPVADWKADTKKVFDYMRTVLPSTTPILVGPQHRWHPDYEPQILQYRVAETEIESEMANVYIVGETAGCQNKTGGNPHLVGIDTSDQGYDRYARFFLRAIMRALGDTSVVWKGPEVVSGTIVDATHTDITLTYPTGCGGTDFTPTTGIEGFKVYDAGVSKAISAAARTSATVIRLTHASVAGVRTVRYEPTDTTFAFANLVKDNFTLPMPLRMSGLLTAEV